MGYADDMPDPRQIEIYKKMTPEQKFNILCGLYRQARELKTAGLRMQHPDWTEEQIQDAVREIFLHART